MKSDEKRSHRINMLYKIWVKTNYSDFAVIQRAVQMGVTKATANDYLRVIKTRRPQ